MKTRETYDYSRTPQARYDKENTTFIGLRLEIVADSDIIGALNEKPKQTEVKKLVRLGIGRIKHDTVNKK